MLRKIVKIKNVGRFDNCSWRGGTQFEQVALIYGENSRGKSTFCDVLRSLQSGVPDMILGRKRLGASGDAEIELRTDSGNLGFKNGAWSSALPNLAIFDTAYVHNNVFAGDRIDHEHKRNQYRLIVGEAGMKLAERVDQLDDDIRTATKSIDEKRASLIAKYPKGTDLAAINGIAADPDIATKIAAQQIEIRNGEAAAARSMEIKLKLPLSAITLPAVPPNLLSLLSEKISNVGDEAEKILKKHLAEHTNGATEDWVSQGLEYSKDDQCPYCGQSTAGVDIIATYRSFFDRTYKEFEERLLDAELSCNRAFGQKGVVSLNKTISENASLLSFWQSFGVKEGLALPDLSKAAEVFDELESAIVDLFKQKYRSLTVPVAPTERYHAAVGALDALRTIAESYNAAVLEVNADVEKFRAQQSAVNLAQLRSELSGLKLVETKQTQETKDAAQAFADAEAAKKKLESDKAMAKADLDAYSAAVLKTHDKRINELLGMFGAGFLIGSTERSYVGGKPSSTYSLLINRVPVALGDDKTPTKVPSFKNTLSAGDRNTLALAFFISQLERDPALADKVIVFDDPFTSQDRSRRSATLSLIGSLSAKAKQVFILSHDPFFLRACWDAYKGGNTVSCHQFFRLGDATTAGEWDIERETLPEYSKKHKILWDYCHSSAGSPLEVAQTIRPVLEEYLRLKLPRSFADNEWLGQFIDKIRNAPSTDPLAAAQVILSQIEYINEYGKRFHHSSTRAADTAVMDETELCTYAKATLDLVGGF
jgi:wobble nucleotide-excising tRNase